jgi:hypothetical protein
VSELLKETIMDERLEPLIDYYIGYCMDLVPRDSENYCEEVYNMAKGLAECELYGPGEEA